MGIIKRQGLKGSLVNYAGVVLGALFFLLIFPNILDEKYLGFYQLILSLTLVFAQLPLLGLGNILYKYYDSWRGSKRLLDFNAFAFRGILLSCVLFTILYFIFREPILALYSKKSPLFTTFYYIIPPLVMIQALSYYLESYCMMKLRVVVPTFIREVIVRILLIVIFSLLAYNLLTEELFVATYVLVYFVAFGLLFYYSFKYFNLRFGQAGNFRKNNSYLKDQFDYAKNAWGVSFLTILYVYVDAIILPMLLGLSALGIYGRPLILGQMISIPYRSIANIASPIIMQAWHDNDTKKIEDLNKKLSINLLIIGLFLFALIVINASNFFELLPPVYRKAEGVLYIIAFGRMLDMSFGLNSEILFSSKYYRWIVWLTLITLILTISLNLILIPRIGMIGAAIAITISLVLFNILKSSLLYFKFGFHCFSKHYITLLIICATVIAICLHIPDFSSVKLNAFFGSPIASVLANTTIKSTILIVLFIPPVLFFRVSEDFNSFFKLVISGKIFSGGHKLDEL